MFSLFATGLVDTDGKFAADIVDTIRKFATSINNKHQQYQWCTLNCEYLRKF
jgi:hypothetical protein